MKKCSTCQEEFADKFSFCPVDGTPLNGFVANAPVLDERFDEPEETIPAHPAIGETIPQSAQAAAASDEDEQPIHASTRPVDEGYHLTMLDDAGLISRLFSELRAVAHQSELTWPEFKRDPKGFLHRSFASYFSLFKRFLSQPGVALSMTIAVSAMLILMLGIVLLERSHSAGTTRFAMLAFGLLMVAMLVAIFAGWFKDRTAPFSTQAATPGTASGSAGALSTHTGDSQSAVFGMIAAFLFILFVVGGFVGWSLYTGWRHNREVAQQKQEELEFQGLLDIPAEQEKVDKGTAGMNKGTGGGSKPKQEKPQGGGGGGREESKPASVGKLPQASLDIPQVVAPDPHPPTIKNPSLPVPATIKADPLLFPTDTRPLPYGDPKSKSTETSSGPGTGNGIGTGSGGGVGSGEGGGVGPGRGGNTGGGDFRAGGGGAGGGGGGDTDYNKTFQAKDVSQKARILSKPEPQYTEEARKNQVSGTVVLRAVFASNGSVTNIRAVSSLPYGLTEKAISAARMIKFMPAMKDGRAVSQYIQIEYNFNLY
ncbi:MAG TPA: TonB family protein [Pyrinomonadaceae bacterium]|jgi:TonB family protein